MKDKSSSVAERSFKKPVDKLSSRIGTLETSYEPSVEMIQKEVEELTLEIVKIKDSEDKAMQEHR